jgi:hypothetical protein
MDTPEKRVWTKGGSKTGWKPFTNNFSIYTYMAQNIYADLVEV